MILSIDLGTKNFSFCILKEKKILDWSCFEIGSTKDSDSKICSSLLEKLDALNFEKYKGLTVVIEKQTAKNTRTLKMFGFVFMYFTLLKQKNPKVITKILGYHAGNKLKYYEFQKGDEPLDLGHLKKGYYKNKVLSKEHTKRVLLQNKESNEWIKMFTESKKQDDLGDSFLMALAYTKL